MYAVQNTLRRRERLHITVTQAEKEATHALAFELDTDASKLCRAALREYAEARGFSLAASV